MRFIGWGLTTEGEADRWMEDTLQEFDRLCDETIILGNNASDKERELVEKYGFHWVEDNREWGKYQWQIKEEFIKNEVSKLNPDWCVCLDMDEVFDPEFDREALEEVSQVNSYKFFIVNLYNDGYSRELSFEDVRLWQWREDLGFEWEQKPVHCGMGPKWTYYYSNFAPHFILHKGLMKESDRKRKQERYDKYDPDGKHLSKGWYTHLNDHQTHELDLDTIRKEVKDTVDNYKYNHIDKSMPQDKKKYYKMKSPDGKVFNIKERNMERQRDRYGFELLSDDPIVVDKGEVHVRTVIDNTDEEPNYEDMEYKELQRAVSSNDDIDLNPVGTSKDDLIEALKNA